MAGGTRDKIVESARALFHEQGFNATGLAEILKKTGVGAGSLYHFFSTKEDLLSAVLDWYLEHLEPAVIAPAFAATDDPIGRALAVLRGYREMLLASSFNLGCPVGNLALEVGASAGPAVREKIALNFSNWCKALQGCFEAAGDRLPRDVDRGALARFALTVMEGGIMQARSHRDIAYYDATVAQFEDYLNRLQMDAAEHRKEAERSK